LLNVDGDKATRDAMASEAWRADKWKSSTGESPRLGYLFSEDDCRSLPPQLILCLKLEPKSSIDSLRMKFLNLFIVCTWLSSGCAQYFAGLAGNVQVQNFIDQRHLKLDKFRDILTKRITDSHSRATALELLHNVLTQLKASAFPTAISENVDPQCRNDSLNYVHSYYSLALWALKSKSNIFIWLIVTQESVALTLQCTSHLAIFPKECSAISSFTASVCSMNVWQWKHRPVFGANTAPFTLDPRKSVLKT